MSQLPDPEPDCLDPTDEAAVDLVIEGRPRDVGSITVARLLPEGSG